MKTITKCFAILLILTISLTCNGTKAFAENNQTCLRDAPISALCSAQAMALIEKNTGRLIMEKNSFQKLPMASTTKIMTAITVIEHCADLNMMIPIPKQAEGIEGSSVYLKAGEEYSIWDLLYGLMLRSGNDCAVALALTVGGTIEGFADIMNTMAKHIGAVNTNFTNPHGLHDDNHYTTAHDLALISAYAMRNESFYKIVSSKNYQFKGGSGETIYNKNKILTMYDGGDGIKTGYTKKAGRCLVSSATRNGMCLICVVLNCGPMFEECSELMSLAFNSLCMSDIICTGVPLFKINVKNGTENCIYVGLASVMRYPLTDDEVERLKFETDLPKSVSAPIDKGKKIGKINIYLDNQLLFSEDLFTINSVQRDSFWKRNTIGA